MPIQWVALLLELDQVVLDAVWIEMDLHFVIDEEKVMEQKDPVLV